MNQLLNIRLKYYSSHFPKYKDALEKYYKKNEPITGFCCPSKSMKYSKRNPMVNNGNWRLVRGIK